MSDDDDAKVSRYEWERWVRRCCIPSSSKLVAFVMATYAARDGSRIFPGVSRLAATTGLSERTVRTALGNLRDVGLIERIYPGGRRGTQSFADVHRLAIPADLLTRVPMLNPDEDALPKRQQLPVGKPREDVPNRQPATSQPATDDAQPATDDLPTGNGCTPTAQGSAHRSAHLSTEDSGFVTRPTTGDYRLRVVPDLCGKCDHRWIETPTGLAKCPRCYPKEMTA